MNQTIKQQSSLKDYKHCKSHKREVCLGAIEKDRLYPRWYEWAFFGGVSTIIAVVLLGFMYVYF